MFFHQPSWTSSPKFMPYACLCFWGLSLHWWLGRVINSSSSVLWFIISVLVMCPGSCITLFCQNKQVFGNSCLHCVVWWIILRGCFSTVGQWCYIFKYVYMFRRRFHQSCDMSRTCHVDMAGTWGSVTINPFCALDGFVFPLGYS